MRVKNSAKPSGLLSNKAARAWTRAQFDGADLAADTQAPVISYVATSDVGSFSGDLKAFFDDATTRSGGFTSDLLLTDVFFGFEIWNPVSGLKVDNFSVKVE